MRSCVSLSMSYAGAFHGKQSYILKSKEVKITAFALYFANIVGARLHENETK